MNRVWAVYFSATGTTKKIVICIANALSGSAAEIFDFTLPKAREEKAVFTKEDIVVFGAPVYAGRVPNVLLKYLNTLEGGGAKAVPVVLYGNRNYDDAGYEYHKSELEAMYERRAEPELFLQKGAGTKNP